MAAIYKRRHMWWVRFYHPQTRALVRGSLGTSDPARAELLRLRVERECALLEPRIQSAILPPDILQALGGVTPSVGHPAPAGPQPSAAPIPPVKRHPMDAAVRGYLDFVRTDNAPRHVQNKLSMLRRFLGIERTLPFCDKDCLARWQLRVGQDAPPFFTGEFVDEITPALLQEFFNSLEVGKKTKRHYREFFHHFFQYCIRFGLYQPTNFHCPNPMAALPSYMSRNETIVFLSPEDVTKQLEVLKDHPEMRVAAALMIHAGLRRAEMLWITRSSIAHDLSFLSVINKTDEETRAKSSLKTGERTVTILPPLREILAGYLPTLKGAWLVKKPNGGRWNDDAFGRKLRSINDAAGLKWTCLHYRHTYATQRAAEGWPLFRIAKEMGNSAAVVEKYYAGFVRPSIAS